MKNLAAIIVIVISQSAVAQSISTDAPSVSAGATTVGGGIFQIESRIDYSDFDGVKTLKIPANLFRLGIGNKFELRMTNGINNANSFTSLSPFTLGLKAQLLNKPEGKTQIALLLDLSRPNFKNKFYSGMTTLSVNHALGEKNSIGYNFGFGYTHQAFISTNEYFNFLSSLIYSYNLTDKLSLFAEVYGTHMTLSGFSESNSSINFDAGILYLVNDRFQIDYSFGIGVAQQTTYYGFNSSHESSFHAIGFNFMFGQKRD